jgi:hypothetical protein
MIETINEILLLVLEFVTKIRSQQPQVKNCCIIEVNHLWLEGIDWHSSILNTVQ